VDAAALIGPVVVDHGETGCVTPAAIPYIEKTLAYRQAQAAKRAAKATAAKPATRSARPTKAGTKPKAAAAAR
jgi:hypothetical protein